MDRSIFKRIGNVFRIALLAITLVALGTVIVWMARPDWVHSLDKFVIDSYQQPYRKQLQHAEETASRDPEQGAILYRDLLRQLAAIEKLDRLDPIKRQALAGLIPILETRGRIAEGLNWAERWIEFDQRDLNAHYWLVSLMAQMPGRESEATETARELFERFPSSLPILTGYARSLIASGEPAEAAFLYLNTLLETVKRLDWQAYWNLGQGFKAGGNARLKPVWSGKARLELEFEIPAETKQLRLDPPTVPKLSLIRPKLRILGEHPRQHWPLWKRPLRCHDMQLTSDHLLVDSSASDPYCSWSMPATGGGPRRVRVSTDIGFLLPDWLRLLDDDSLVDIDQGLLDRGEADSATLWRNSVGVAR